MAAASSHAKKVARNRQHHGNEPSWKRNPVVVPVACINQGGCLHNPGDITGGCVLCLHPDWVKECGGNTTLRTAPKTCKDHTPSKEVEETPRKIA